MRQGMGVLSVESSHMRGQPQQNKKAKNIFPKTPWGVSQNTLAGLYLPTTAATPSVSRAGVNLKPRPGHSTSKDQ